MLPVAPVVEMAALLVYELQLEPPSILTWKLATAPVDPPEPAVPVTVPVLYPAQTTLPLAGEAELSVGAVGVDATVQLQIVLQLEFEQP